MSVFNRRSQQAIVTRLQDLTAQYYLVELELTEPIQAVPGMFVQIALPEDPDRFILPRPISIASLNASRMTLLLQQVGRETTRIRRIQTGELIHLLGPLGNGFPQLDQPVLAIGGGVGLAPLLYYMEYTHPDSRLLAGFRSGADYESLIEGFPGLQRAEVSTEDDSWGIHGLVTDLMTPELLGKNWSALFVCGPEVMMKAVAARAAMYPAPVFVSLETYMGCGYGVCVGCAVPVVDGRMLLACKDGPVFRADLLTDFAPALPGGCS